MDPELEQPLLKSVEDLVIGNEKQKRIRRRLKAAVLVVLVQIAVIAVYTAILFTAFDFTVRASCKTGIEPLIFCKLSVCSQINDSWYAEGERKG